MFVLRIKVAVICYSNLLVLFGGRGDNDFEVSFCWNLRLCLG